MSKYIKKVPWDYDLEEALRKYGLWGRTKFPYKDLEELNKKL